MPVAACRGGRCSFGFSPEVWLAMPRLFQVFFEWNAQCPLPRRGYLCAVSKRVIPHSWPRRIREDRPTPGVSSNGLSVRAAGTLWIPGFPLPKTWLCGFTQVVI